MSLHAQPPTRMARIGYYIGPFALLSVVTSVAFNRAILARERAEQRRLHELQMSLLNQLHAEASSQASSSTSSVLSSLQEQRKLARRMRALQLDPLQLGFSRQVLPSPEEEEKLQRAREATTSWGRALFGSGTLGKLKHSIAKARQEMHERGFGSIPSPTSTSEEDEADAAWVRALEESLDDTGEKIKAESHSVIVKEMEPKLSLRPREEERSFALQENDAILEQATPTTYRRRVYA